MPDTQTEYFHEEWLVTEVDRLRRFVNWWKAEGKNDPEIYPEKIALGEWDEQYRCWSE